MGTIEDMKYSGVYGDHVPSLHVRQRLEGEDVFQVDGYDIENLKEGRNLPLCQPRGRFALVSPR